MTASTKPTTTDAGAPVASDEHSLTIGADGPIVLNDHYLIEQIFLLHTFSRTKASLDERGTIDGISGVT
jgi:catalase